MKLWILIVGGLLIAGTAAIHLLQVDPDQARLYADVSRMLAEDSSAAGFARAVHPREFEFPGDLGPHQRYQTEWWYFTGNLSALNGRSFGYQLTFFRRAIQPRPAKGASQWRTNQLYMAHFAVSDVSEKAFLSFERFSRGSPGLAGAEASPFRVWLENWQVSEIETGKWLLSAEAADCELQLELRPLKPMILNGNHGLSQKGPEAGNASYYFSATRIKTEGMLRMRDQKYSVNGFSWMDKEWSTSVLSRNQIGWDWFSIQLDDWREIMLFQIRESAGGVSEFSSGTFVDKDGSVSHITREQFEISVLDYWESAGTGKRYPSGWRIEIPSKDLTFTVIPLFSDQEHRHSFAYWEGAVSVSGDEVSGKGYAELTGY